MQRLAQFIRNQGDQLDGIIVTLDSHQRFDIAHPGFWQTVAGADVAPFTPITAAQVLANGTTTRELLWPPTPQLASPPVPPEPWGLRRKQQPKALHSWGSELRWTPPGAAVMGVKGATS